MKRILLATLVLFSAAIEAPTASGQTPSQNQQGMPWFARPPEMPGMPYFFRPPTPPKPQACRVDYWYPAQFWNTDQWGHSVTWAGYAPHYVCG